ncbi:MAG: DUF2807 domain-containing protein [Prolixibacteraceae bacterium]|nr:DUF2807 domain-containing protein [Prolixibacteraceae bacterium]
MKTKISTLIIFAIMITGLSGCIFNFNYNGIVGNGDIAEETRSLPDFTQIISNGSFQVYFEYADSHEVRLICESNLLPYVETSVFDNRLDIRTSNHVSISHLQPIELYVKGPTLNKIINSGSGEVETCDLKEPLLEIQINGSGDVYTAFKGNDLEININGSGDVQIEADCRNTIFSNNASGDLYIEGITDYAKYTIMGSGNVNAYNYPCLEAEVYNSASGDTYLNVEELLSVNINGSGDVYYVGFPIINRIINGSGDLINKN